MVKIIINFINLKMFKNLKRLLNYCMKSSGIVFLHLQGLAPYLRAIHEYLVQSLGLIKSKIPKNLKIAALEFLRKLSFFIKKNPTFVLFLGRLYFFFERVVKYIYSVVEPRFINAAMYFSLSFIFWTVWQVWYFLLSILPSSFSILKKLTLIPYISSFLSFLSPFSSNYYDPIVNSFNALWKWLVINYFDGYFFLSYFFNSSTDTDGYETSWGFFPEFLWIIVPNLYDYGDWFSWYPVVGAIGAPAAIPVLIYFLDAFFFRPTLYDNYRYAIFYESESMFVLPEMYDDDNEEWIPATFYYYSDYYVGWAMLGACFLSFQMDSLWGLQEFYFADTHIQAVINNAWDVPADIKDISHLRLSEYKQLYDQYSYTILTQVQHQVFQQTYLDVLQIRYGPSVGHFFYQTPNSSLSSQPFYFTKDLTQTFENFDIQLTTTLDKIIEIALDKIKPIKSHYAMTIQDYSGGEIEEGSWIGWIVPDFLFYLEDIDSLEAEDEDILTDYEDLDYEVFGPYGNVDDDDEVGLDDEDDLDIHAEDPDYFGSDSVASTFYHDDDHPEVIEFRPSFFYYSTSFFDNIEGDVSYQYQSSYPNLSAYDSFLYAYKPFKAANLDFLEELLFGKFSLDYFLIMQQYLRPRYDTGNYMFNQDIIDEVEELEHRMLTEGWNLHYFELYSPFDYDDIINPEGTEVDADFPFDSTSVIDDINYHLVDLPDPDYGVFTDAHPAWIKEIRSNGKKTDEAWNSFYWKSEDSDFYEECRHTKDTMNLLNTEYLYLKKQGSFRAEHKFKGDGVSKFIPDFTPIAYSVRKASWFWPVINSMPLTGRINQLAIQGESYITTFVKYPNLSSEIKSFLKISAWWSWYRSMWLWPHDYYVKNVFWVPDFRYYLVFYLLEKPPVLFDNVSFFIHHDRVNDSYNTTTAEAIFDEVEELCYDLEVEESEYGGEYFWAEDLEFATYDEPLVAITRQVDGSIPNPDDDHLDYALEEDRILNLSNWASKWFYKLINKPFQPLQEDHLVSVTARSTSPRAKIWPFLRRFRHINHSIEPEYFDVNNVDDYRKTTAFDTVHTNSWVNGIVWDVPAQIQVGALHYAWPFAFDKRGLVPVEWFYSRLTRNDFSLNYSFFEWWSPNARFVQLSQFGSPDIDWYNTNFEFNNYDIVAREGRVSMSYKDYKNQNVVMNASTNLVPNQVARYFTAAQQLIVWRMNATYGVDELPKYVDVISKLFVPNWRPLHSGSGFMHSETFDELGRLHNFFLYFYESAVVDTCVYGFHLIRYINGYPIGNAMQGVFYPGFSSSLPLSDFWTLFCDTVWMLFSSYVYWKYYLIDCWNNAWWALWTLFCDTVWMLFSSYVYWKYYLIDCWNNAWWALFSWISNFVSTYNQELWDFWGPIPDWISNFVSTYNQELWDFWGPIPDWISNFVFIWNWLVQWLIDFATDPTSTYNLFVSTYNQELWDFWGPIPDWISSKLNFYKLIKKYWPLYYGNNWEEINFFLEPFENIYNFLLPYFKYLVFLIISYKIFFILIIYFYCKYIIFKRYGITW